MINAHNLCLSFGEQPIFKNVSFTCNPTDRIGLVGRNGSGKSTLLKAIAGKQALDDGAIAVAKHANICYLPQEVVLQSTKSILDETYTAFEFVARMKEKKDALENLLAEKPDNVGILEEYAHVCSELFEHDLDALQAEAKKVLMGLGFKQSQLNEPVASLSGGWKMRVVLAKLLLQKADFYLFDEPTNHLDIVAQEWFLQFLKTAPFGFMIVCHDRYFLNELCTLIFELDPALYYALGSGERSTAKMYAGNYTTYEIQKEHDLALLESAFKTQQKDIKQKMETIDRFRASASKAKMAQSMLKAVEKIERIELPPKPSTIHFTFPPIVQPGKLVLTVRNVAQSFGTKQIFHNVHFEVERGKKLALIAPNGVGKTTLFNIIAGKLPVQTGTVELGHNVKAVVFDQDQTAALKLEKTVLENLYEAHQTIHEQKIRSFAYADNQTLNGFEKALWNTLTQQERTALADYTILREIPFDPIVRKNITILEHGQEVILVIRGTVEGILQIHAQDTAIQQWIVQQEQQARRVLAIAKRIWPKATAPTLPQIATMTENTESVGFISFTDPVKKTAPAAINQAQELGIVLKVLSGDSADVCGAVAQELGLIKDHTEVITGAEFESASATQQEQLALTKTVFARVTPKQKYDIIHYLQQHYLVGYLGDGINDAPALKAAHVSMVVNDAAATARQAADIIMLKKNLATIIDGVQEGRKTFLNTLKYIKIATVSNFGNFYALAIGSLILDYLPMLPFQVLLENLLTDLPMVALATDSNDKKELRAFVRYNIKEILLISMVLGSVNSFFHGIMLMVFRTTEPALLQTIWFTTSMLIDLLLIYSLRVKGFFLTSNSPSLSLVCLITCIGAIAVGLPYTAFGQNTLLFVPLQSAHLLIIAAIAITYLICSEAAKLLYYRFINGTR